MKAVLYSQEGKKKGEVVLNPLIYAARVNRRLLDLVHTAYAGNLRHGTADTKTRKDVRGGGKKPWKQKGTGRARHGSSRSPIWRGGGTVFGPHPRSYVVRVPDTMRRAALISALSLKADQKNLVLLEGLKLETPKTKELAEIVRLLPLHDKRALCVVKTIEANTERAGRNLASWMRLRTASDLNAWDVLQREKLIIEQDALPVIEKRLKDVLSSAKAAKTKKTKTEGA